MNDGPGSRRRWTWTPAPGWPQPPEGWIPGPGWAPDPAWPPTPQGWSGWQRTKAARRLRFVLVALLALLAVAGCTALLHLAAVVDRDGHSIDPTDPANFDLFALHNGSASPLYVRLCNDQACRRFASEDDWTRVRAGSTQHERVYWGDGASSTYAVSRTPSLTGLLGCLPLHAIRKTTTETIVQLSSTRPCRPSPGG